MKNVRKGPGKEIQNREYKITNDSALVTIDSYLKPILYFIFRPKKGKEKIVKTKSEKAGLFFFDIKQLLNRIEMIEKIKITDPIEDIHKISSELATLAEGYKFTVANSKLAKKLKQNDQEFEIGFDVEKEKLIKQEYFKSPESEYIYNVLYRYKVASTYKDQEYPILPKIILDKVLNAKPGERSEKEMAFITNLKLRNFEDIFIKYLIHKYFPIDSKCIEDPGFLNQALMVASSLTHYPDHLNKKDMIWIQILQCICLIRKINFHVYEGINSDKARIALETLFNWASVTNSWSIALPLKELTLTSHGRINYKSLRKYLTTFENNGMIEKIDWETDVNGEYLYPKGITLCDLTKLSNLNFLPRPLYFPQDGHQNLIYQKGVGIRTFLIIDLLRKNINLNRKEIYSYFSKVKDYRRVIRKQLKLLTELKIISLSKDNTYTLTGESNNRIYSDYVIYENEKESTKGQSKKRRGKNPNPLENKVISYQETYKYVKKKLQTV
ncbi:hypothetical protein [Leptospira stimsonii]|uniref:Uncharacterized protein n=1 Tax=Leptospira stimsonii TaxID=2202203 RepID=A0ABY2N361_9LEPT|nr:hypothetical protein [Leptospira stimsonii]TGK26077.1 hypothetical protein EHO98_00725 [Leptospira stimsonii]TGM14905.1 hypothetical protein EHQ90_10515 [Leptospira stimsonii]